MESIHNFYVFVDLQGFKKSKNSLICKEFCLLDDNGYVFHAFVKPTIEFNQLPVDYKRQATWLMNNHHKIDYDFGDMDSIDLCDQIYPKMKGKIVLVKGQEKVKWLKDMLYNYGEIECYDIYSLDFDILLKQANQYDTCDYHNDVFEGGNGPCAMSNALFVQDLAHKNRDKL